MIKKMSKWRSKKKMLNRWLRSKRRSFKKKCLKKIIIKRKIKVIKTIRKKTPVKRRKRNQLKMKK